MLSPKYFNFPLPITLTMIHMGFSGAVAFFLVRVFKVWFYLNSVNEFLGLYSILWLFFVNLIPLVKRRLLNWVLVTGTFVFLRGSLFLVFAE